MKSIVQTIIKIRLIFFTAAAIILLTVMGVYSAVNFPSWKWAHLLKNSNYVKDEILVKYKNKVTYAARRSSVRARGGTFLKEFGRPGLVHVCLPKGLSVADALARYSKDPNVEHVQPNYIYYASLASTDPSYTQEWGLNNTGQVIANETYLPPSAPSHNPGTPGKDMNMENTWGVIHDCSSVTVAVVDSGVNYNHQDLTANMWNGGPTYPNHGYDFVDNDNDPMDLNGHGTHVAATIGARGDNGVGTVGVCWQASIMAVRVLNAAGYGTTEQAISGINFAIANGAKVINMSFGGFENDSELSDAISNARNYNAPYGIVVITSAGNGDETNNGQNLNNTGNGYDDVYPCEFTQDNILCVAALDQAYSRATFSNYGSTSVDVGAPGTNILSAYNGTQTPIHDDFSGDWTKDGGWGEGDCGGIDMLMNPSDWCTSGSTYASSSMDWAYKDFDLTGYQGAVLYFYVDLAVETNKDFFSIYINPGGGSPFLSTLINKVSTTGHGLMVYDISKGADQLCSVGFELTSNNSVNLHGIGISIFYIFGISLQNNLYMVADGTSMAAPHVSGLAAILKAYNPDYTYADIIQSIKQGGDSEASLAGITSTGKAVDSWGSLCYIQPPTSVAASVVGQ
jgi:thermitase